MANVENIKKELENIKYPGFAKSIIEFGFVKDIQVDGTNCSILLDITSTAAEVEAQLRKEITACLSVIGINVTLNFNKPQEQKQASNSVSGKNIAPQIKKVVISFLNCASTSGAVEVISRRIEQFVPSN